MTRLTLWLDFPSGSWLGDVSGSTRRDPPHDRDRRRRRGRRDRAYRHRHRPRGDGGGAARPRPRGSDRHRRSDRSRDEGPSRRTCAAAARRGRARGRDTDRDPVAVTDGRATLDIVDDRSRLTAFGRRLTAEGVTVGIEASDADEEPILTDAQRDLVLAAVAAGYYDTPERYAHGPRQGARPREVDVQRDAPPGRGPGVATVRGGRVRRRGQRDKRRERDR